MSVIPFKPVGSVIIVIPHDNAPAETASGIVLADVTYDPSTSGTIVAVGDRFCCASCEGERDAEFAIGERVLFGRGAGAEIDGSPLGLPGERFLLLRESEILAVLAPDAVCEVV
jgi:co-chaperonin GroES (HSP10)